MHRLAEVSRQIIDQCVAQGVPFAREYGGLLDTRSFGGAQVSRTFYARGQTGQQLLLGAYQALERQIGAGTVTMYTAHEMLDLIVVDGRARGIVARDLVTGRDPQPPRRRRGARLRRLRQRLLPVDQRQGLQRHRELAGAPQGALFANPCYTQIHPTCIPVTGEHQSKLTLMSESLRNDGRVWVPEEAGDDARPGRDPRGRARLLPGAPVPGFGNLVPRDIASRAAKNVCDEGRGVGPTGLGVYLDFADAIDRLGPAGRRGEVREPVRDVRADHRRGPVRGADADLPGRALHDGRAVGRLRPAEHHPRAVRGRRGELLRPRRQPARRLRADAGPGRRLLRAADHDRRLPRRRRTSARSTRRAPEVREAEAEVASRIETLLSIDGDRTVDSFHRELGQLMWEHCGMERTDAGLRKALDRIPELRGEFWSNVKVPGTGGAAEPVAGEGRPGRRLPRARRADVPRRAAPHRVLRRPLPRGEPDRRTARRRATTSTSPTSRPGSTRARARPPVLHKEDLHFEYVTPSQRSYK